MKLTEKTIAGLKLPAGMDEQLVSDDELTGLSLRLRRGADGVAKSWVYRYMVGGLRTKSRSPSPATTSPPPASAPEICRHASALATTPHESGRKRGRMLSRLLK